MKRFLIVFLLGFVLLCCGINRSYAGETDLLIQKLVEKGIITGGEAQELKAEIKEDAKKQMAQGTYDMLPPWVQTIKFKGDFRYRFQRGELDNSVARDRHRFRLRVGAEAKVVDKAKVFFGLASGSDADPRSTNQTLQNSFAKKDVWIDYAYSEIYLSPFTVSFGRMKNPIWEPSDLMWDTDINPEGLAVKAEFPMEAATIFANAGYFMINEFAANTSDPAIYFIQPGVDFKIGENATGKAALTYYGNRNMKDSIPIWTLRTNSGLRTNATGATIGGLTYEYNVLAPSFELGLNNLALPYMGIFGEYVENPDPSSDNTGYIFGGILGSKKVGKKGEWRVLVSYRQLEKDAWYDFIPDSDFYGGATGVKGYEGIIEYGLMDNVTLCFDYYKAKNLSGTIREEDIYQFDFNWKF